jgi:hypothetical protein
VSYSVSKHQRELNDMADWQSERRARDERLDEGSKFAEGKMVAPDNTTALLEAVIRPGDRICLEGDNQKQADFLAACLAKANPKVLHDLHVVQSGIVLPEHIDLFEKGIARRLDYSYSGPQGAAVARALNSGKIELGAIHTYIELFARYVVDGPPREADFWAAQNHGNGVGLMFAPVDAHHLGGIDLDSCRNPQTEKIEGWAEDVIARFSSYTEVSPSGTGAKVFFSFPLDDAPEIETLFDGKYDGMRRGCGAT